VLAAMGTATGVYMNLFFMCETVFWLLVDLFIPEVNSLTCEKEFLTFLDDLLVPELLHPPGARIAS
jgi:hypothetical protein